MLAVGGGMANTFLFAEGREIGRSLCERNMADRARQIQDLAHRRNCRMVLPEDVVVAAALEPGVASRTVAVEAVPSEMMILDIGPRTETRIGALLAEAHTLVWNGPLGAFETPPFDRGTMAVAKQAAELTRAGKLLSVAGGGDTVAALDAAGVAEQLSYVSTAGGAFLEWLEGRELPGVAALASVDRERPRSICADAAGGVRSDDEDNVGG
jgi:phosphoglycerate kinase